MTKDEYFSLKGKWRKLDSVPAKLLAYYDEEPILYDYFIVSTDGDVILAASLGLPSKDIWELRDGIWTFFGSDSQFCGGIRCNHAIGEGG